MLRNTLILAASVAALISPCGISAVAREAAALTGEQLFMACAACHSLAPGGEHKVGPNLHGAISAPAASQAGFRYSPALQASGLTWDRATLITWLVAGEKQLPGTWMLFDSSTLLPAEVPVLVDYLIEQTSAPID